MKNIFFKAGLFVFIAYWLITFLFIMPNNPVNLTSYKANEIFQANFFQRWAFFAPPPTYNQRVYFVFKNKCSQQKDAFEVLEPILLAKSKNAPFNDVQQIKDYIFSYSLINTDGNIRMLEDIFKNQNAKTSLKVPDSVLTEKLVTEIERTNDFKTLANYSKIIARNNGINPDDVAYQIQIVNIYIPQFIDRNLKIKKEVIMFSSHFLNFI